MFIGNTLVLTEKHKKEHYSCRIHVCRDRLREHILGKGNFLTTHPWKTDNNTPNGFHPHWEEAAPNFSHDMLIYNRKNFWLKEQQKEQCWTAPQNNTSLSPKISTGDGPCCRQLTFSSSVHHKQMSQGDQAKGVCWCLKEQAVLFQEGSLGAQGCSSKCIPWTAGFSGCKKGCSLSSSPFSPS